MHTTDYCAAVWPEAGSRITDCCREHIAPAPAGMYIGSVERQTQHAWVYDGRHRRMAWREVSYSPGLLKLYDEILVNACDNKARDPSMTRIEITIHRGEKAGEEPCISILNDGRGIPVAVHAKEGAALNRAAHIHSPQLHP